MNTEGIKTEVRAWNVPIDADIRTTLLDEDAAKQHIIFGPLYSDKVGYLANFCKTYDIKMVIPFSITGDDVTKNSNVFQVYQSPEELNRKSIGAFLERFPGHQAIFINCNDDQSTKAAFTKGLRQQLAAFYAKHVDDEMDELWENGQFDEKRMKELRGSHFRTPYND